MSKMSCSMSKMSYQMSNTLFALLPWWADLYLSISASREFFELSYQANRTSLFHYALSMIDNSIMTSFPCVTESMHPCPIYQMVAICSSLSKRLFVPF